MKRWISLVFLVHEHAQCAAMRIALVAHHESETNLRLVEAAPLGVQAEIVRPSRIRGWLGPGDAALARIDVLRSLDGMETGSWEVGLIENEGIRVLNPLSALMATHDKLQTARLLEAAGLPHPRTIHFEGAGDVGTIELPVVLKPRFGSWGSDVMLCTTRRQLTEALAVISERPWFRTHGVLMQELIPPLGHDMRIVISAGQVVGAVRRQAAEGEWRTNVALGAERQHADPPRRGDRARAGRRGRGGSGSGRRRPAADRGRRLGRDRAERRSRVQRRVLARQRRLRRSDEVPRRRGHEPSADSDRVARLARLDPTSHAFFTTPIPITGGSTWRLSAEGPAHGKALISGPTGEGDGSGRGAVPRGPGPLARDSRKMLRTFRDAKHARRRQTNRRSRPCQVRRRSAFTTRLQPVHHASTPGGAMSMKSL